MAQQIFFADYISFLRNSLSVKCRVSRGRGCLLKSPWQLFKEEIPEPHLEFSKHNFSHI